MLQDKVILYDDSCPMCSLYTRAFVKMRILLPEHRVGFASASQRYTSTLDMQRARHEIPLLDLQTGQVVYGIDALILLVGHRIPILKPILQLKFIRTPLYCLYQYITYNRRVIAGTSAPAAGYDCAPDFNLFYRALHLILAMMFGEVLVSLFLLKPAFASNFHSLSWPGMVTLLSIPVAILGLSALTRQGRDLSGSLATCFFSFSLLLTPTLLFNLSAGWSVINAIMASLIAVLDCIRRIKSIV